MGCQWLKWVSGISLVGTMANLASRAQTAYSVFQIATGEKEFSAREVATNLLLSRLPIGFMKNLLKKGCKFNSFDGSTLVSTKFGLVSIEEIHIGDLVWAYDETTGNSSLQEVVHIIVGDGEKTLVDISLESGEIITATDEHPFYLPSKKAWVNASELEVGSVLLGQDGSLLSVVGVKSYKQITKVYNLTVNNDHTFYVGSDSVLSHNEGICEKALKTATKNVKKIQSRALKRGKGYHGRIPQKLEEDIIKNPDGVYLSEGGSGRMIFHKGGDVVVVEGKGSSVGNIITSYGSSGPRGPSGVAALGGGSPNDPGEAITAAKIIAGKIPMPGGGNLPAAVLLNTR